MARKRRPTIVVDEHVHTQIAEVFREVGFRTLLAARDRRYAGCDEHDYVGELYAANEVFVTSDLGFLTWVLRVHGSHHAGLIVLPFGDDEFRVVVAAAAAGWVWGLDGRRTVRDAGQNPLLVERGPEGARSSEPNPHCCPGTRADD